MGFNDSVYSGKPSLSQNDKRALEIMQEAAVLQDSHYTIVFAMEGRPTLSRE